MRFADEPQENPLGVLGALGGYSKSLPCSGAIPTSLARVPGKPQKHLVGEFRVSPRTLLCGVSLPEGGTTGVGVDERVESASGRQPNFNLLDVDQIEQAAPICALVESHGGMASFDDSNLAPYEVDAVRTVIPLAVSSVDLHGDRLVNAFSPRPGVRPERRGEAPAESRGQRDPNTPSVRGS
jgi:hypothetical protein